MTAPIPSVTRLKGPSARLRVVPSAASASARSVAMDLVAQSDIRDPGEWLQSISAPGRRAEPLLVRVGFFWCQEGSLSYCLNPGLAPGVTGARNRSLHRLDRDTVGSISAAPRSSESLIRRHETTVAARAPGRGRRSANG